MSFRLLLSPKRMEEKRIPKETSRQGGFPKVSEQSTDGKRT